MLIESHKMTDYKKIFQFPFFCGAGVVTPDDCPNNTMPGQGRRLLDLAWRLCYFFYDITFILHCYQEDKTLKIDSQVIS